MSNPIRSFFNEIYSATTKLLGVLNSDEEEELDALANTEELQIPDMKTPVATKFGIDYTKTIAYFVITFSIILIGKEAGFSDQAVTFTGIALTYTLLTSTLTNESSFFILLELIAWTTIIELLAQINYVSTAWSLVLLIPAITIMQSLFYLLFYLT